MARNVNMNSALYGDLCPFMTREQIEERMNELARKYLQTHDPKIPYELYELACQLEKMEKKSEATK
jgi:hypothetical protein